MAESVASHDFCARMGIGTMSQSLSRGRIAQNWKHYQEAASKAQGRPFEFGEGLAIMRSCYVAESMRQAKADTASGMERLFRWSPGNPLHIRRNIILAEEFEDGDDDIPWQDFQIKHDTTLIGTPDTAAAQVRRLRGELQCQHLALFLNIPGLSLEQVKRSLTLFATEVAPQFA